MTNTLKYIPQSPDGTSGRPVAQNMPKLLLAGIDSLYCSYFIDGLGIDWEELAYHKACAQADRARVEKYNLGGKGWVVSPAGLKPYPYILRDGEIELRLAEHMEPRAHVRFSSKALWIRGQMALLSDLREWFAKVGTRETRPALVSRVDWALDFDLSVIDFGVEHFCSRAKKDSAFRGDGKLETFQFGRGATVVRVYDKVKEIVEASSKAWFYDLWGQSENIWRVEVQMRREKLKDFALLAPEDLEDSAGDVLLWALGSHTSLRVPTDDSNRSRRPLHPLWQAAHEAAQHFGQLGVVGCNPLLTDLAFKSDQLLKSIDGLIKRYAVLVYLRNGGDEVPSFAETLEGVRAALQKSNASAVWNNEIKERAQKSLYEI